MLRQRLRQTIDEVRWPNCLRGSTSELESPRRRGVSRVRIVSYAQASPTSHEELDRHGQADRVAGNFRRRLGQGLRPAKQAHGLAIQHRVA